MRELKFRSWNKEIKRFIFSDWKYGIVAFWDAIQNDWTKIFSPPEQYTGLQDKNGKEIYEGDILTSEFNSTLKVDVKFENGSFTWADEPLGYNLEPHYPQTFIHLPDQWAIVIGNIHENPELLK